MRARHRVSRGARRRARFRAAAAWGLAAVALSCASPAPPEDPGPDPDQVSWAGPVDFTDFRTKFGERDDFAALCERDRPLRGLYDAAAAGDWQTVLDLSGPWLLDCPVDIDAHYLRSIACGHSDRPIDSTHHEIWFQGLVGSVLESGDGSRQHPYVVISVSEEYALLRALRLEPEEAAAGGERHRRHHGAQPRRRERHALLLVGSPLAASAEGVLGGVAP